MGRFMNRDLFIICERIRMERFPPADSFVITAHKATRSFKLFPSWVADLHTEYACLTSKPILQEHGYESRELHKTALVGVPMLR